MGKKRKSPQKIATLEPATPTFATRYEALSTHSSVIFAEATVEQEQLLLATAGTKPANTKIDLAQALILKKLRANLETIPINGWSPADHLSIETVISGRFDTRIYEDIAVWAIRSLLERKLAAILLEIHGVSPVVKSTEPETVLIHSNVPLRRCRALLYHRAEANPGLVDPDECESPFQFMTPEEARNRPLWLKLSRLLIVADWHSPVRENAVTVEKILDLFEAAGWARVRLDGITSPTAECVKTMQRFLKKKSAPISFCSDGEGYMICEHV